MLSYLCDLIWNCHPDRSHCEQGPRPRDFDAVAGSNDVAEGPAVYSDHIIS
jgi:hypothetical protein